MKNKFFAFVITEATTHDRTLLVFELDEEDDAESALEAKQAVEGYLQRKHIGVTSLGYFEKYNGEARGAIDFLAEVC